VLVARLRASWVARLLRASWGASLGASLGARLGCCGRGGEGGSGMYFVFVFLDLPAMVASALVGGRWLGSRSGRRIVRPGFANLGLSGWKVRAC